MNQATPAQNQLSSIAVVGAGTMRRGIAVSAALAGYQRVARPFYGEAVRLLGENAAGGFITIRTRAVLIVQRKILIGG